MAQGLSREQIQASLTPEDIKLQEQTERNLAKQRFVAKVFDTIGKQGIPDGAEKKVKLSFDSPDATTGELPTPALRASYREPGSISEVSAGTKYLDEGTLAKFKQEHSQGADAFLRDEFESQIQNTKDKIKESEDILKKYEAGIPETTPADRKKTIEFFIDKNKRLLRENRARLEILNRHRERMFPTLEAGQR